MEYSAKPALIVFAWGNASRGDDGIGPLIADRLRGLAHPELVVVEDFQLNIEHVMDFDGTVPLVFVDASVAIEDGIWLESITASEDGNFSTHAISPQALLNVYRESTGNSPPPAFLLHIAGQQFGLGDSLSQTAQAAVDEAGSWLEGLFGNPSSEWLDGLTAGNS